MRVSYTEGRRCINKLVVVAVVPPPQLVKHALNSDWRSHLLPPSLTSCV